MTIGTKFIENIVSDSSSKDNIIIFDKKTNDYIALQEDEKYKKYIDAELVPVTIRTTGTNSRDNIGSKTRGNPALEQDSSLDKYTSILINMMFNEDFESGFSTESEKFIKSLLEQNQFATMLWLNDVFIRYIEEPKVIVGILHIISHFDYKKVFPNGQTIAMAGAFHKNVEVKDYAVKAFENWNSIESIPILKMMDCQEEWLQNYVNELIHDLEEELQ